MKAPCGLEDCDCGHTIEKLEKALACSACKAIHYLHPNAKQGAFSGPRHSKVGATCDRCGEMWPCDVTELREAYADRGRQLTEARALEAERALRKVKPSSAESEVVCSRCGMLCLIRHKARTIELPEGYVYFHDAHKEDCWEQEKSARAAQGKKA